MRLMMMMTGVVGAVLWSGGLGLRALASVELTDARVAEVQAALTPSSEAPWRTIPWRIGLLEAQREAARAGKPIFVWAMDGHPLGCT